jgi:hypothetical protein
MIVAQCFASGANVHELWDCNITHLIPALRQWYPLAFTSSKQSKTPSLVGKTHIHGMLSLYALERSPLHFLSAKICVKSFAEVHKCWIIDEPTSIFLIFIGSKHLSAANISYFVDRISEMYHIEITNGLSDQSRSRHASNVKCRKIAKCLCRRLRLARLYCPFDLAKIYVFGLVRESYT